MKLFETWVKHPQLRGAEILLLSECLGSVWPQISESFSQGRTVLTICPEAEADQHVIGKLASIIRSASPKGLIVLTVGGSPHCSLLHALVNEAIYLTSSHALPVRHLVVVEGKTHEVAPETVRIARYLHLVDKLVRAHPEVLAELSEISLEHQAERRAKGGHPASCG